MSSLGTFPEAAYLLDCEPGTAEPIVVASDGTAFSDPALESALRFSRQSGSCVFVVAIHQITPPPVYEFAMVAAMPALLEAEEGRREALRRQVEEQVRRIVGSDTTGWQIIVRDGEPATELSRIAAEVHARLLVMGVKHRKFSDRVFGRELALRLIQECRTPVLIVPSGFAHAPRKILIATDFSPASIEAGRMALDLFDSVEQVTLVHVTPSTLPPAHFDGTWQEWLDEDATRGFEWAKAEFALPDTVKVETVTREGHAARVIVDLARDRGVDLIVTSSRGAGLINRLLVGSTARGIVRAADCAVLVVRPQAQTNVPYPLLEPDREPISHNEWADALADFSKRNLGRRASIEVDDPDVGAQTQERNYYFHGASWDPKCSQVEIMVGDATGTQRHLTRNIADVRSIHILPDASGKDWILRVAHGNGQTLLTLQR